MATRRTTRRIAPGFYEVRGYDARIEVFRVVYPGDGVYWVVTIDGRSDFDPFYTKREALNAIRVYTHDN